MNGKNRIMIFGPRDDGTYVVEFRTAAGGIEPPRVRALQRMGYRKQYDPGSVVSAMLPRTAGAAGPPRHWGNSFTRTARSRAAATCCAAASASSCVSYANDTSGLPSSVVTLNPCPTPLGMLTSMTSLTFHMLLLLP